MAENPIIAAAIMRARQEKDFRDDPKNRDTARRVVRLSKKKKRTTGQWNTLRNLMSQVTLSGHDASPSSVRALFSEAIDSEK